VTFDSDVQLEKSDGVAFDVGLRSSKDILLPRHLKTCEYPYTECTSTSPLEADGGSTSSRSQIAVVESSSPVRTREVIDSGVVRVQIPQRECDPRAHGALGDGRTDDTLAIQAAIDECASALGGTVALTCKSTQKNCTFASFPLKLTGNNTEFHIDESATLRFSSARNDSRWQGVPAAILGSNVHDLAITEVARLRITDLGSSTNVDLDLRRSRPAGDKCHVRAVWRASVDPTGGQIHCAPWL
jgi:hypothetical protein